MNNYHSNHELKYKKRWLASLLRTGGVSHPVIVLTGARQVGKSTLLRYEEPFNNWRYVTMDDFDMLYQAKKDPFLLWAGANRIVLDEVQKSPNLLEAVKVSVDQSKRKSRFILSGSANLLLMKQVSESLAGRAVYYTLYPMTPSEIEEKSSPNILESLLKGKLPEEGRITHNCEEIFSLIWKGFMPPLMELQGNDVVRWWEGYVATYLERDLRQLSQIDSLPDFRRLMEILALRCAQILNQTEISRDTGISQPTVHRYINLLKTTCLVEDLPAFARSRTKRLIKSPKILWIDPGLATFLMGYYIPDELKQLKEAGSIFESFVFLHLRVLAQLLTPQARLYYWRTTTGKEVDFILEWGRHLLAFEVKLSTSVRFSDIENLRLFLEEYPETSAGVLIYNGNEIKQLHEKIVVLPWKLLARNIEL